MTIPLPPDVPLPGQAVETEQEERALCRMSVFEKFGSRWCRSCDVMCASVMCFCCVPKIQILCVCVCFHANLSQSLIAQNWVLPLYSAAATDVDDDVFCLLTLPLPPYPLLASRADHRFDVVHWCPKYVDDCVSGCVDAM